MPDDIDTAHISHAFEIKSFQRTPITSVTALYPIYLHDFFSFRHTSSVSGAQGFLVDRGELSTVGST